MRLKIVKYINGKFVFCSFAQNCLTEEIIYDFFKNLYIYHHYLVLIKYFSLNLKHKLEI